MSVFFIGQIMAVFLSVRNDVLVRRIVVPMYGNVRMPLRVLMFFILPWQKLVLRLKMYEIIQTHYEYKSVQPF